MKLVISLSIIMFSFGSLACETTSNSHSKSSTAESFYPGKGRKKGGRREKRINKKRKRKCHQFGRRAYAG